VANPHTPILSPAIEDYLKAIYKLQDDGAVSTTDLAGALKISSASVTNMVKRLAKMGLVDYQSYKGVTLTPPGVRIALEIIRHHRLLETYLKDVLGYPWDKMHEEAERLEHHISEEFERRIEEMMGYPTHDPHGHPIPTRDGQIASSPGMPLSEVESGRAVVVRHVDDKNPDILTYLESLGLMPRCALEVVDRAPFSGPITLRIAKKEHVIGHEVARHVFVAPSESA